MQMFLLILLILVHDALILLAGFALANNAFTLNLEGGLIVGKRSVRMVPKGGEVTVGSGKKQPDLLYQAGLCAIVDATCEAAILATVIDVVISTKLQQIESEVHCASECTCCLLLQSQACSPF